jgi:hypothetical protein
MVKQYNCIVCSKRTRLKDRRCINPSVKRYLQNKLFISNIVNTDKIELPHNTKSDTWGAEFLSLHKYFIFQVHTWFLFSPKFSLDGSKVPSIWNKHMLWGSIGKFHYILASRNVIGWDYYKNRICGIMVSVFAWSAVSHGFKSRSCKLHLLSFSLVLLLHTMQLYCLTILKGIIYIFIKYIW